MPAARRAPPGRGPADAPVDWRETPPAAARGGRQGGHRRADAAVRARGPFVHLARLDGGAAPGQGSLSLVYDLGGGTFDCAVLRRRGNRFQLIGLPGRRRAHRRRGLRRPPARRARRAGSTPEDWARLQHSEETPWRRAAFELRRSVREAKEAVSQSATHPLLVGAPVSRELQATRDGFEDLIRADVERTLEIAEHTLAAAGVTKSSCRRSTSSAARAGSRSSCTWSGAARPRDLPRRPQGRGRARCGRLRQHARRGAARRPRPRRPSAAPRGSSPWRARPSRSRSRCS